MYLAEEQGQKICDLCSAMARRLKTLKTSKAYKIFFFLNVSETCYMIDKRKMFKQVLRKCVLGM